jgi:hypothetical protein
MKLLSTLKAAANYTCVAADRRDPKLTTSVSVSVYLAKRDSETCQESFVPEVNWQQTFKVSKNNLSSGGNVGITM